jgi:hydroxyacylglutathione hydrolase
MRTPGHTPEHISFTVAPAGAVTPEAVFSGGALIVGGAARTDLLGHDLSEPLARHLYHTLYGKLLKLPDDVSVYPTHGAGSFCAAPASKERVTTIGQERLHSRLAHAQSEEEFVRLALSGLPSYPEYYRHMRGLNQAGPRVLGGVPMLKALTPEAVRREMERGAAVVDVRSPGEFAAGHVPGAYGIPLVAPLTTWAGWVVPFGRPVVLVAEQPAEREEAVRQLIRIGYDRLSGYLDGGIAAWQAEGLPVAGSKTITREELHEWMQRADAPLILDVRFDREWKAGHLPGAIHIEAGSLIHIVRPLPDDRPVVIHCATTNRSTVSVSLLEQRGYRNLIVLKNGFKGWQAAGYEVVQGVV